MKDKKISILGAVYSLKFVKKSKDPDLEKCDGYVDAYTKEIVVCKKKMMPEHTDNPLEYMKKNARHEIVHAFLYESGLAWDSSCFNGAWATNEEMVDWMAIQWPKITKAFEEAGVLE